MTKERRKRTRVPVNFDLSIVFQGKEIQVQTNNISMTGVSFVSPHTFTAGTKCTVQTGNIVYKRNRVHGLH